MAVLKHIIWICQWYPHDGKPYAGDFIQRHAQAVSQFIPITVFACFPHPTKNGTDKNTNGNLTEIITYYKPISTGIHKLDNTIRWLYWYIILKKRLLDYKKEFGQLQLLHCHILLNAGWLGLWAKKKWKIPFVATEHWSGYMPIAVNGYDKYNKWSKNKLKSIIKKAACVTCVSHALIEQLQLIEPEGHFIRVPNVVNEKIFNYKPVENTIERPTFIHVSTGSPQKNIKGLMEGFAIFCKKHPTAILIMVCPKNKNDLFEKNIENNIVWYEDMPQPALAELMRQANGCILFSNYETFGCIIIEANAMGIPVIVSNIPVLQELVTENENGTLAEVTSPISLANALEKTIRFPFNKQSISNKTLNQFSYQKIGEQFVEIYKEMLTK